MKYFLVFAVCLVIGCEGEKVDDLLSLCTYRNTTQGGSNSDPCSVGPQVSKFQRINGIVRFDSNLNEYVVVSSVSSTYDCEIIGILCGIHELDEGAKIEYSASFFECNNISTPIAGTKIFVLKDFKFRVN